MAFSFVSALGRSLVGAPARRPEAQPPAAAPSVRLRHLLLAHGRKPGGGRSCYYDHQAWSGPDPREVKLFIEELSATHCRFRTTNRLAPGEELEVQLLLQGVGCWGGRAKVEWLLESCPGFCGQALLEAPDNTPLGQFVELQLALARG
ncbi:MAG: hypothetical protein U0931_27425 [Vulcanimicrobiota bacterium]